MKKALQFLLQRMREPSTWIGVATAGTALNIVKPEYSTAITQIGPVLAGLAACFLPDGAPLPTGE